MRSRQISLGTLTSRLFSSIVIVSIVLFAFPDIVPIARTRALAVSDAESSQRDVSQSQIVSLPFCSLVRKAHLYDQQIGRTTAILVAGYEQFFFYSPRCVGDELVWAEQPSSSSSDSEMMRKVQEVLSQSIDENAGRAHLSIVGRFVGPGPRRFGHLDQFRLKFVILRIEQVKGVPSKTAWPRATRSTDSLEEQSVRHMNNQFVFHLAGVPNYSVIPSEILADDFRFTGRRRNY